MNLSVIMTKYKVETHELHWVWVYYEVEAESEEEAIDLVYAGEGQLDFDLDCIDQIDIEKIEKLDD
jgi:hypothetical protein